MKTNKFTSTLVTAVVALVVGLLGVNSLKAADFQFGYSVGSGLLGPTLFDTAAPGGGDTGSSSEFAWSVEMTNLWQAGDTIKITGVALPIRTATTSTGTWTFVFYDLDKGTNANAFDGTNAMETVVGTATVEMLTDVTAIGAYYATFDTPIKFTAASSGIAVRFSTTGLMRLKINTSGALRKNTATGATFGTNPFLRFTLAGSVEVPPAAGTLVWKGNVNGDWDVATTNWDYALGDNTGFTTNYSDNGTSGPSVIFNDSLNLSFLNTNINLTTGTPLRPTSLTFGNDIYGFDLGGPGKITGGTVLTNLGTRAVTLNTANDFTGGSVLINGRIRLGNIAGLSTGPITFEGGGLSSVGATPLTINNPVFLSGAATLGDVTDNGLLTFPGTLDFNGGFSVLNVKSDVLMSGVLTNGGIDGKTGPGTLTLNGQVVGNNGSWGVKDGLLIASGAGVQPLVQGVNVGASAANGVATLVITNGANLKLLGGGSFAMRVGAQGQSNPSSSNYLHLAGTLGFETNVAGVLGVGAFSAYDEVNMYPGSSLRIGGISYQDGTATAIVVFNINGATIAASDSNTNFISDPTAANVSVNILAGGVTFDSETNSITIARPLLNGGGGGGLTKKGTGSLWLAGASTYTGPTIAEAGTLGLYTGAVLPPSSPLIVSNGAAVGVNLVNAFASSEVSSLSLNGSTISGEYGDLFGFAPSYTAISFGGGAGTALNASGVNIIRLTGSNFGVGQYSILQFASRTGAGSFVAELPLGVEGSVATNGNAIVVNITKAPASLTWYGFNGATVVNDWNTTAQNWNFGAAVYQEGALVGDKVTFDDNVYVDSVSFIPVTNVNVGVTVKPISVTINNNLYGYAISGAGKITGLASLTKQGLLDLTLSLANDFTGGSSLEAGAVYLGDDLALGTGPVALAGGGLSSDSVSARTLTNDIAVSAASTFGDAAKTGALSLSGLVDFTGAGRDLTVNSPVTFSGSMTNGGLDQKLGAATLTFSGVTGEQTAGQWQVEEGDFVVSGGSIDKVGGGLRIGAIAPGGTARVIITNSAVVTFTGAGQNMRLGNNLDGVADPTSTNILDVAATLGWSSPSGGTVLIGYAGALAQLNLRGNGVLRMQNFSPGTSASEVNLDGGTLAPTANRADFMAGLTNVFVRSGGVVIDTEGFNITIAQPLLNGGGSGGLIKNGAGMLNLDGLNTYTGPTVVNGGALGGIGSLAGPVTVNAGGTLAPGTSVGTLAINNSLNLAGNVLIEVDKSLSPSNDVVSVTGALIYGGTITAANIGAVPLVAGDQFQVFPAGGTGSLVEAGSPGPGLAWSFDESTGILSVVSAAAPTLDYVISPDGSSITFNWTGAYKLVGQTNGLNVGLTGNWFDYPGGGTSGVTVPVVKTNPTVFFGLQPQ